MTRPIHWSICISLDSLWFKVYNGIRFMWIKPIFFEKIAKINIASLATRQFFGGPGQRVCLGYGSGNIIYDYGKVMSTQVMAVKIFLHGREKPRNVWGRKSIRRKGRCCVFPPCLCFNAQLSYCI